jgi:23S rRNA (guanine745-N1)-methyltransferase
MKFIYQCPVCNGGLEQVGGSLVCEKRHTYDVSKEGYVNFLLAHQKNSKAPGDGALMIESRQKFLDGGFYDLLSDEINKIVTTHLSNSGDLSHSHFNILDAGCGVGFYCGRLRMALNNTLFEHPAKIWGIDISKVAIQKAAKKFSRVQFSVGSNFHLPYLDSSLDFVFSVFSPFDTGEIIRVLKPGGKFLLVRPGPGHLKELAALIYNRAQLQGTPTDLTASGDLSLLEEKRLQYEIHLRKNEDILNLVNMTPYHWHVSAEKKAQLSQMQELTTGVDLSLSLFSVHKQEKAPADKEPDRP